MKVTQKDCVEFGNKCLLDPDPDPLIEVVILLQVHLPEATLLMTEPLFNLPAVQRRTQEVVFEEFGFAAMHAEHAAVLALHHQAATCPHDPVVQSLSGVVVDAGYSFTHAVPIFDGQVQLSAVKRVNIGGKALTNLLKELVRS